MNDERTTESNTLVSSIEGIVFGAATIILISFCLKNITRFCLYIRHYSIDIFESYKSIICTIFSIYIYYINNQINLFIYEVCRRHVWQKKICKFVHINGPSLARRLCNIIHYYGIYNPEYILW